jgi:hypothetical protein
MTLGGWSRSELGIVEGGGGWISCGDGAWSGPCVILRRLFCRGCGASGVLPGGSWPLEVSVGGGGRVPLDGAGELVGGKRW